MMKLSVSQASATRIMKDLKKFLDCIYCVRFSGESLADTIIGYKCKVERLRQ